MTQDSTTTEEKSSRSYWGFVLWPVIVLLPILTHSGCALFPRGKKNVECASVPFQFGTNMETELSAVLPSKGGYHLYLLLRTPQMGDSMMPFPPLMLPARMHVLVLTNGEAAIDKELPFLYLANRRDGLANYSLVPFHAEANSRVLCRVKDMSDGGLSGEGTLNLQQLRHH